MPEVGIEKAGDCIQGRASPDLRAMGDLTVGADLNPLATRVKGWRQHRLETNATVLLRPSKLYEGLAVDVVEREGGEWFSRRVEGMADGAGLATESELCGRENLLGERETIGPVEIDINKPFACLDLNSSESSDVLSYLVIGKGVRSGGPCRGFWTFLAGLIEEKPETSIVVTL